MATHGCLGCRPVCLTRAVFQQHIHSWPSHDAVQDPHGADIKCMCGEERDDYSWNLSMAACGWVVVLVKEEEGREFEMTHVVLYGS